MGVSNGLSMTFDNYTGPLCWPGRPDSNGEVI